MDKEKSLKKENDDFLFSINAATTYVELKKIVDDELIKRQTEHYNSLQQTKVSNKKSKNRKMLMGAFAIAMLITMFFAGINQRERAVTKHYEEVIRSLELDNQIIKAISSNDTESAIELMKENGNDELAIAEMLMNAGRFNEAIQIAEFDERIEEKVVARLHEINQRDTILTLESETEFMEIEKMIVEYDLNVLPVQVTFVTNENTLQRMAQTFIRNYNVEQAMRVQERMQFLELDYSMIGDYIRIAEIRQEIEQINSDIFELRQNDGDEAEISGLNTRNIELQQELMQLEEELGGDS